ncbi:hypothetical protein HPB50_021167 [Hyalomma asiaticum]|uniref:Uncharacterized protein n=1 Tax=Hyalomma asiaticum TaxID=266040 RepID=A0ACB7S8D1_HYAAI|nr:hypothetical protein HPB50_021167 [Hyalomma asiaticum]
MGKCVIDTRTAEQATARERSSGFRVFWPCVVVGRVARASSHLLLALAKERRWAAFDWLFFFARPSAPTLHETARVNASQECLLVRTFFADRRRWDSLCMHAGDFRKVGGRATPNQYRRDASHVCGRGARFRRGFRGGPRRLRATQHAEASRRTSNACALRVPRVDGAAIERDSPARRNLSPSPCDKIRRRRLCVDDDNEPVFTLPTASSKAYATLTLARSGGKKGTTDSV